MVDVLGQNGLQGLYGEDPAIERFSDLRRYLHGIAVKDATQWVLDQRFVTRFVLSGAVFLSVFVLSSVLLRIPVPIVDDLLIALGSAIVTFFALARHDSRSRTTLTAIHTLRNQIDQVRFEHSAVVATVEEVLQRFERSSPEEVLHELKHVERTPPNIPVASHRADEDGKIIEDIRRYLTISLRRNRDYACRRVVHRWMRKPEPTSLASALRKLRKRDADVALLGLLLYLESARLDVMRLEPSPNQDC